MSKVAARIAPRKAGDGITDEIRALAAAAEVEIPEGTTMSELRSRLAPHLAVRDFAVQDTGGEAMRAGKRDREKDRVRVREEPPSGFAFSPTGWLEEIGGPTLADVVNAPTREITAVDQWIAGRLGELTEIAMGEPPLPAVGCAALEAPPPAVEPGRGYQMTPNGIVPLDPPTTDGPEVPAKAPVWALARLRAAYVGAFGRAPEDEWKHTLRLQVDHALHNRQGKQWEGKGKTRTPRDRTTFAVRHPDTGKIVSTDGEELLRVLRMVSPPGTVPRGLTARAIDGVLQTATLGRGGGNKRAKRHSNVDTALEALFVSLAQKA